LIDLSIEMKEYKRTRELVQDLNNSTAAWSLKVEITNSVMNKLNQSSEESWIDKYDQSMMDIHQQIYKNNNQSVILPGTKT